MCFLNGKLTITHQYQEILTGLCTTYRLSLTTFICKIFRNSGCCSYITKNSYCPFVVERAYCIIVSSFDCHNYYLIVLCQMPASNLYRDFNQWILVSVFIALTPQEVFSPVPAILSTVITVNSGTPPLIWAWEPVFS